MDFTKKEGKTTKLITLSTTLLTKNTIHNASIDYEIVEESVNHKL